MNQKSTLSIIKLLILKNNESVISEKRLSNSDRTTIIRQTDTKQVTDLDIKDGVTLGSIDQLVQLLDLKF